MCCGRKAAAAMRCARLPRGTGNTLWRRWTNTALRWKHRSSLKRLPKTLQPRPRTDPGLLRQGAFALPSEGAGAESGGLHWRRRGTQFLGKLRPLGLAQLHPHGPGHRQPLQRSDAGRVHLRDGAQKGRGDQRPHPRYQPGRTGALHPACAGRCHERWKRSRHTSTASPGTRPPIT